MEESYRQNLDDPDKKIAGIPKMLDKFEGRYEKLMAAMSKKYPLRNYEVEKLSDTTFDELIKTLTNNPYDSNSWKKASEFYESVGKIGRSNACEEHSKTL